MLDAVNIDYKISEKFLLKNISLKFKENEFAVIMGKNGAGKTTLLRILSGSMKPTKGEIMISGKNINSYERTELAKKRAVLSQHYDITFPITVEELVTMGRYPHFKELPSKKDKEIINMSMELTGISDFLHRDYNTLSGGEAQKVQMARIISQIWQDEDCESKILFLDEPVSSLDMHYQHIILKLIKEFASKNILVISVIHDINLAFEYADRVIFLKEGSLVKSYNTIENIDAETIKDVFEVDVEIIKNPFSGNPLFLVR